ncbi:MAG: murein L,D-transpeptidase catalytic domain-containing protein [Deltaproteobacteria bacterium]
MVIRSLVDSFRVAAACFTLAACVTDEPEVGTSVSALDLGAFVLPQLSAAERAPIVRKYDALDPNDKVPRGLLEDAIIYFDLNKAQIPQTAYFVVVDLSLYSGKDRFWLVDLATGAVENHKVAHGSGSDPDNNGYATLFGNVSGSLKSSLGFYLTGEIYDGTHPHSMRLDGLSVDGSPNGMADTNVRSRLIVIHEASYVSDTNSSQQGRSDGCLALDPSIEVNVVDRIHDGTLIYTEISPLAPPVGRAVCGDGTCDASETHDSCVTDCATTGSGSGGSGSSDPPADGEGSGNGMVAGAGRDGCSAGGSPGFMIALVLVGVRRRRSTCT